MVGPSKEEESEVLAKGDGDANWVSKYNYNVWLFLANNNDFIYNLFYSDDFDDHARSC